VAVKKNEKNKNKPKKQDMQPTFHCNKPFEHPTKVVQ